MTEGLEFDNIREATIPYTLCCGNEDGYCIEWTWWPGSPDCQLTLLRTSILRLHLYFPIMYLVIQW